MEKHGVLTIALTDGIIGCPHQEGIDHEGESCPVCEFWRGRDRLTGQWVHLLSRDQCRHQNDRMGQVC